MSGHRDGRTTVVLFTRDLRVHDQFLLESLADLDESLRALGGRLVVRRGDPTREAVAVAWASNAKAVFTRRGERLRPAPRSSPRRGMRCTRGQHRAFPLMTVVAPGAVLSSGGDHFRVFTPY